MTPEEMLNRRINKLEALVMPPMALRDWFAGQALVAIILHPNSPALAVDIARYAWEQADAMLAQREKQP